MISRTHCSQHFLHKYVQWPCSVFKNVYLFYYNGLYTLHMATGYHILAIHFIVFYSTNIIYRKLFLHIRKMLCRIANPKKNNIFQIDGTKCSKMPAANSKCVVINCASLLSRIFIPYSSYYNDEKYCLSVCLSVCQSACLSSGIINPSDCSGKVLGENENKMWCMQVYYVRVYSNVVVFMK